MVASEQLVCSRRRQRIGPDRSGSWPRPARSPFMLPVSRWRWIDAAGEQDGNWVRPRSKSASR